MSWNDIMHRIEQQTEQQEVSDSFCTALLWIGLVIGLVILILGITIGWFASEYLSHLYKAIL